MVHWVWKISSLLNAAVLVTASTRIYYRAWDIFWRTVLVAMGSGASSNSPSPRNASPRRTNYSTPTPAQQSPQRRGNFSEVQVRTMYNRCSVLWWEVKLHVLTFPWSCPSFFDPWPSSLRVAFCQYRIQPGCGVKRNETAWNLGCLGDLPHKYS